MIGLKYVIKYPNRVLGANSDSKSNQASFIFITLRVPTRRNEIYFRDKGDVAKVSVVSLFS